MAQGSGTSPGDGGEERGLTLVVISSGRGTEKRQRSSSIFQETHTEAELKPLLQRSAYEGTLVAQSPTPPPLANPGQLMIPINNPDPEISDRSCSQSKTSPEAASQA